MPSTSPGNRQASFSPHEPAARRTTLVPAHCRRAVCAAPSSTGSVGSPSTGRASTSKRLSRRNVGSPTRHRPSPRSRDASRRTSLRYDPAPLAVLMALVEKAEICFIIEISCSSLSNESRASRYSLLSFGYRSSLMFVSPSGHQPEVFFSTVIRSGWLSKQLRQLPIFAAIRLASSCVSTRHRGRHLPSVLYLRMPIVTRYSLGMATPRVFVNWS